MKNKKLTLGNFKRDGALGSFSHYFTHTLPDGREVCLEACMSGYCVGIYDKNRDLVKDKVCTEMEGMLEAQIIPGFSLMTGEALQKAIDIANDLIR